MAASGGKEKADKKGSNRIGQDFHAPFILQRELKRFQRRGKGRVSSEKEKKKERIDSRRMVILVVPIFLITKFIHPTYKNPM